MTTSEAALGGRQGISRRITFVRWVRKTHGWFGLWGALLGLMTVPMPWILLIDTMAGSLIFLAISGTILWWETNRRRGLGLAIFGLSVLTVVALALTPLQP